MHHLSVHDLTKTALLIAVAILIPIMSPVKVVIPPASFTLLSHVPIFLAMFISPPVAITVTLGSTLGFFLAGFPPVVVLRAFSHLLFVCLFSWYIQQHKSILKDMWKSQLLSFEIAVVHGIGELLAVFAFYALFVHVDLTYEMIWYPIIVLVFFGTIAHSLFDFFFTLIVARPLNLLVQKKTPA